MRRALLPLLLVLSLGLAGCAGDDPDEGDDGGSDGGTALTSEELARSCDALSEQQVQDLVGVPVEREDQDLPGGASCTWFDQTTDEPGNGVVNVVVLADDGSWDDLQDLAGPSSDDLEVEPLDLAGAEEAIVVDDDASGIASTLLLARTADRAFTVYPTGLTRDDEVRIGTGVLSVLLGGEPGDAVAARSPVPHPCDQVTATEAAAVLGGRVSAERSKPGATPICVYLTPAGETPLTIVDLGRLQRVEEAGRPLDAAPSEPVDAPAPLVAYAPADPEETGSTLVVATDRTVLSLQVEGPDGRAVAEELLPALV